MKVIFLDVDGVLNELGSTSRCCGMLGVDEDKVKRLSDIVMRTKAVIVLTSTWKSDWFRCEYEEDLPTMGLYLQQKLRKYGVHILDKTTDVEWSKRGDGIKRWMNECKVPIESFCIIDDETFDYEEEGLMDRLVKTSFYGDVGGLHTSHVERAIELLNNTITKVV